jgi:ubiquinone/menaquinone biosynthesis C-methylase UbiE
VVSAAVFGPNICDKRVVNISNTRRVKNRHKQVFGTMLTRFVGRNRGFAPEIWKSYATRTTSSPTHENLIKDQFTRQATGFNDAKPIADTSALALVVNAGKPGPGDVLVDIACGGGLVACSFAPHVKKAIGVDLTPAMLDNARARAAKLGLENTEFILGDANSLPFDNASIDIASTRFSFHHFERPLVC